MIAEPILTHPDALWSSETIARWFDYSPEYVARTLLVQPGFPAPVYVLGKGSRPRWIAGEVMAWARSLKAQPSLSASSSALGA